MNCEQICGLIISQNIGILGNNMIFTVSTLLASVDISVVSNKCITKFLGSLE